MTRIRTQSISLTATWAALAAVLVWLMLPATCPAGPWCGVEPVPLEDTCTDCPGHTDDCSTEEPSDPCADGCLCLSLCKLPVYVPSGDPLVAALPMVTDWIPRSTTNLPAGFAFQDIEPPRPLC